VGTISCNTTIFILSFYFLFVISAPGVDVQCNKDNMTIIIPKSLLRGIDREHLRLRDTTCKPKETSADFSLTTPLTDCNTTRRQTPLAIVYSNTVLEIPVAAEDVVTRVREIEIQFSCFYSKYGVVSSVGWKPSNRKLVIGDEGKGNFTLSLNMFPDKRFVSPYTKGDFPVAVVLRKQLFFETSVTSGDKQLSIIADRCYATPTQDQQNSLKYEFISKGYEQNHLFHRESEHFIGYEIKCTIIYLCPCVFFNRLEGISMTRRQFTFPNIILGAAS